MLSSSLLLGLIPPGGTSSEYTSHCHNSSTSTALVEHSNSYQTNWSEQIDMVDQSISCYVPRCGPICTPSPQLVPQKHTHPIKVLKVLAPPSTNNTQHIGVIILPVGAHPHSKADNSNTKYRNTAGHTTTSKQFDFSSCSVNCAIDSAWFSMVYRGLFVLLPHPSALGLLYFESWVFRPPPLSSP